MIYNYEKTLNGFRLRILNLVFHKYSNLYSVYFYTDYKNNKGYDITVSLRFQRIENWEVFKTDV